MDSSTVKPPSFSGQPVHVKFTVDVVTPTTSHSENAFDRLMAGSRRSFQMERQNRMPQLPAMKSSCAHTVGILNVLLWMNLRTVLPICDRCLTAGKEPITERERMRSSSSSTTAAKVRRTS